MENELIKTVNTYFYNFFQEKKVEIKTTRFPKYKIREAISYFESQKNFKCFFDDITELLTVKKI